MNKIHHRLKAMAGDQSLWFLLLVLAVLIAYSTTLVSMFSVWWEDGSAYSHGLLLSVIAIYIFVSVWHRDRGSLTLGLHIVWFVFLLLCIPLWAASHLMFIQSAEQFFFLAILFFLFPSLLGLKPSLKYLFPVILLLVAVPVWGAGIGVLQLLTTIASAFLLQLTGITSIRDGFFILVPAGTFEVEAACSGLRYQLAGMSISLLYVYMARMKILHSVQFLACSVLVVFLANVTRIYIVILIGEKTNMQSPLVNDHVWLGWLIFAIYIGLFLWAAEKVVPIQKTSLANEKSSGPDTVLQPGTSRQGGHLILIFLVCIAGPLLAGYFSLERYRTMTASLSMPVSTGDWQLAGNEGSAYPLQAVYPKANGEISGVYKNKQDQSVNYQLYYYLYQEQGHEAINTLNQAYNSKIWRIQGSKTLYQLPKAFHAQVQDVQETVVRHASGKKKLIWLWYQANGRQLANNNQAKLENLKGIIQGNPAFRVNIMSTDILDNKTNARRLLEDFLSTGVLGEINVAMAGKTTSR